MRALYTITALFFLLLAEMASAQEKHMESAEKLFDKYAYIDAIQGYEKIAAKGHKSRDLFEKLGDGYYFNSELEKAEKWYGELFEFYDEVAPEYYYRYAQSLKSVGNYAKADEMLELFSAKSSEDLRAKLFEGNKNYLETIKKNSGRYEIKNLEINSSHSDYGPAFFSDKLVFASSRDSLGYLKHVDRWTNQPFTVLYSVPLTKKGVLGQPEKFSAKVETRLHESTPTFTKNGRTMYFTRNNYNNGKVQTDSQGRILLKIFKATYEGGRWTGITELPFNSNDYSVAHPALSSDETMLYFASNMPGSYGESDIYRVAIDKNGTFGKPENLGRGINTEGKETFPFVSGDRLYFASEGHQGLGGLDVFVSRQEQDGTFKRAYNVGEPVNSTTDDFAFIINPTTKKGFFTSNRKGGKGLDDIYSILETRELEFDCVQNLSGIVTDQKTGEIFSDSKVSLFDANYNLVGTMTTDSTGKYAFNVECGKSYYVRAEKEEYTTQEVNVVIKNESGETKQPLAQAKQVAKVPLKVGTDLAKEFNIEQIYFDLAKYNIRPDAAIQLEKIISFMKEYPTAKIDVRSHTDCRATHKYNEKLSDNRAKSIREYLIKSGIAADRLTGRGYGETQLVNRCADGVECTEEEHQQNRRSEFIIVAI